MNKYLLLDVMDTIVRDPFRDALPQFFGLDMAGLLKVKHPTAWLEFERGEIDRDGYGAKMFADGRLVDMDGLEATLEAAYVWIPGMQELLHELCEEGVPLFALSNYPVWYQIIDRKLGLSRYLDWQFVSCRTGVRKPDAAAYQGPADALGVAAADCIFVDDRQSNCDAASKVGMASRVFQGPSDLRAWLRQEGVALRPE